MSECIFEYHTGRVAIHSFGGVLKDEPQMPHIVAILSEIATLIRSSWSKQNLPKRIIWQRLPSHTHKSASRKVVHINNLTMAHARGWVVMNSEFIRADATVLDSLEISVVTMTRDCPTLVLWNDSEGPVAVAHCGRDQLHNAGGEGVGESVIQNVLLEMRKLGIETTSLRGVITTGIAAEHFPNNYYPEICAALRKAWGEAVVPDNERQTIDLKELVLRQLEEYGGVQRECIVHDGIDTYSDARTASVRANRPGQNMIVVTRRT